MGGAEAVRRVPLGPIPKPDVRRGTATPTQLPELVGGCTIMAPGIDWAKLPWDFRCQTDWQSHWPDFFSASSSLSSYSQLVSPSRPTPLFQVRQGQWQDARRKASWAGRPFIVGMPTEVFGPWSEPWAQVRGRGRAGPLLWACPLRCLGHGASPGHR